MQHECLWCGEVFEGKSNALYCPRPRRCREHASQQRGFGLDRGGRSSIVPCGAPPPRRALTSSSARASRRRAKSRCRSHADHIAVAHSRRQPSAQLLKDAHRFSPPLHFTLF